MMVETSFPILIKKDIGCVAWQALASAHRHLSAPLCRSLVDKVRHQYEALAELMDGPNGPTTPDGTSLKKKDRKRGETRG